MSTYLLRWGPRTPLDEDQWEDAREDLMDGWSHVGTWEVDEELDIQSGDRVVFWREAGGPPGILGTGTAVSSMYWEHETGNGNGNGTGGDEAGRVPAEARVEIAHPGEGQAFVDIALETMLPWSHPLDLGVVTEEFPDLEWDEDDAMAELPDQVGAVLVEALEGGPQARPAGDQGNRADAVSQAMRSYAVSLARQELRAELGEDWDVTTVDVAPFDLLADDGEELVYVKVVVENHSPIRFSADEVAFAVAHQDEWRLLMVAGVEVRTQIAHGASELRLDEGAVVDVTEEFFSEIDELRPAEYDWLPGVSGADIDSARHLRATTLGGIWSI